MQHLNLSTLAIGLGLLTLLLNLPGVLQPARFAAIARSFPRHTGVGVLLMLAATGWFVHYVSLETVSDFAHMKKFLYIFFGAVGVGTCVFVRDFLAVRGLACLLLLLAKLVTDNARLVDSDWRLVLVTWAYLWIITGIWLTVSPWRLRDWIQWLTASESRTKLVSGLRAAFGVFVIALGFIAFK